MSNTEILIAAGAVVTLVCAYEHFVINRRSSRLRRKLGLPPMSHWDSQAYLHVDPRIKP